MIKRIFPLFFLLAACGSGEKTPFCKCMDASNELSEYASEVLNKTEIDAATQAKMSELKKSETELCKEYTTMGGTEMLELKRACTETNDLAEVEK